MSSLLHLNKYTLVPLYTDWLVAADFVNLDSAVCNEALRRSLIKMVTEFPHRFQSCCLPEKALRLNGTLLAWLFKRCIKMKALSMETSMIGCPEFTAPLLSSIGDITLLEVNNFNHHRFDQLATKQFALQYFRSVEELRIVFSSYLNHFMTIVAESCGRLRRLQLIVVNLRPSSQRVRTSTLAQLCRTCPLLESLDLQRCGMVVENILPMITVNCGRYNTLSMPANRNLFYLYCFHSRGPLVRFRGSNVPLRVLQCLLWVRSHHQTLTELTITHSEEVNDDAVHALTLRCPNIVRLDLCGCVGATSRCLQHIAAAYGRLTSLNISGLCFVNVNHLVQLTSCCRGLRELRFCEYFTTFYQHNTEGLLSLAAHCRQLTSLGMSRSSVTAEVLLAVLSGCPRLTELDIAHNYLLDYAFFERHSRRFEGLRCVNVKGCLTQSEAHSLFPLYGIKLVTRENA